MPEFEVDLKITEIKHETVILSGQSEDEIRDKAERMYEEQKETKHGYARYTDIGAIREVNGIDNKQLEDEFDEYIG